MLLVLFGLLLVGVCYFTWGYCFDTFPEGEVVEDPPFRSALGSRKGGRILVGKGLQDLFLRLQFWFKSHWPLLSKRLTRCLQPSCWLPDPKLHL